MGSARVGHDWLTELNWTDIHYCNYYVWAGSESITFLTLPLHFMFSMSYFTTFNFSTLYYCRYRGFYYFCLLTFILTIDRYLRSTTFYYMFALISEIFLAWVLYLYLWPFLFSEVPLTFLLRSVYLCWTLYILLVWQPFVSLSILNDKFCREKYSWL